MNMSLAEMLPGIRGLSAADKLRLIRLPAVHVDVEGDIAPLEHGRTCFASTPAFELGASAVLQQELR
jgi:hypothetical protein